MATISASPRVVAGSLRESLRFTTEVPAPQESVRVPALGVPSAPAIAGLRGPWRLVVMGLVTFVLTIALSGILARAATQMAAVSVSAEPRVAAAESAAYPAWTVAPSDTLWSIAQATAPGADPRATVEVLRALNGLADDHVLQVGEVLQIPAR